MSRWPWIALLAVGFGWRLLLILDQPVVFAWDAFLRVWERDTLFASHWLPLPQLPLVVSGESVTVMRAMYALSGAAGAVAMGAAVARIADRRTGLLFGCLLAMQPTFVQWTTVPYQEGFLLAFLGLALVAWPRGLDADARGAAPWWGAAALALACLCRYEAWAVAAILAGGALSRRRAAALRYLIPAGATIVAWIASAPVRAPAIGGGPFPDPKLLRSGAGTLFESLVDAVPIAGGAAVADLTWVAVPLVAWGVVVAWRRGGLARELMIALGVFCALAVARQANAGYIPTRMVILPVAFSLLAASYGMIDLADRLAPRLSSHARTAALAGAAAIWIAVFAVKARADVIHAANWYAPEAALARALEALPADAVVRIEPRPTPGARGVSLIPAVFGNSLRLDPRAPRWVYSGQTAAPRTPTLRAYWDGEQYVITTAPAAPPG